MKNEKSSVLVDIELVKDSVKKNVGWYLEFYYEHWSSVDAIESAPEEDIIKSIGFTNEAEFWKLAYKVGDKDLVISIMKELLVELWESKQLELIIDASIEEEDWMEDEFDEPFGTEE